MKVLHTARLRCWAAVDSYTERHTGKFLGLRNFDSCFAGHKDGGVCGSTLLGVLPKCVPRTNQGLSNEFTWSNVEQAEEAPTC